MSADLLRTCDHGIVITGAGLVAAAGLDRHAVWAQVASGSSSIRPLTTLEQPPWPNKGGGEAPPLLDDAHNDQPREVRYLRHTIHAALADAKIDCDPWPYDPSRCGIVLGTTLHGMRAAGQFFRSGDAAALSTFPAPATIAMAAGDLGLQGLAITTCSACSSGLASIGLAVTLLAAGDLDLVIAGGYDAISEYAYAGFNSLRLIAEGPIRPFCRDREGMKLGEGYGIVVLECADAAAHRAAPQLAQVLGYGESADAHHLTQPVPTGDGAARAIAAALEDAGLTPADIHMISAHATGTPDNDRSEHNALQSVFAQRLADTPLVTFKSYLAHTLGGAGAVELILSAMARGASLVPPAVNIQCDELEYDDVAMGFGGPTQRPIRYTLNMSLGFGGANASVILGPPLRETAPAKANAVTVTNGATAFDEREVWITGAGVVAPGTSDIAVAIGNEAFAKAVAQRKTFLQGVGREGINDADLAGLLNTRRVRRISQYVKLSLSATTLACRDARIDGVAEFAASSSAILGSAHGSATYSCDYYRQVVKEGIDAANPMLFAEDVPNAGAAHLSLMLGVKGGCQTLIGSRNVGLEAIRLAALRIGQGRLDRAMISTGEEAAPLVDQAYGSCGLHIDCDALAAAPFTEPTGFVTGCGAVTLILESAGSARRRGVRPLAIVGRCAGGSFVPHDPRGAIDSVRRTFAALDRPQHVVTCANATWLDRIDADALSREGAAPTVVSSIYGHLAETFSVMPAAALAATVLNRRLPPLLGTGLTGDESLRAADGEEQFQRMAVLCSDYNGTVAGVEIELADPRD